jgi:hypothetical protein
MLRIVWLPMDSRHRVVPNCSMQQQAHHLGASQDPLITSAHSVCECYSFPGELAAACSVLRCLLLYMAIGSTQWRLPMGEAAAAAPMDSLHSWRQPVVQKRAACSNKVLREDCCICRRFCMHPMQSLQPNALH